MKTEILFDLRRVIGYFFGIVGVILVSVGSTDSGASQPDLPNLNLWAGGIMILFSVGMVTLSHLKPLAHEPQKK